MSDYIISTSSTTDLPESYIKEHGILCLPFSFIISDEQYEDNFGNSMPAPVFYNRLLQRRNVPNFAHQCRCL